MRVSTRQLARRIDQALGRGSADLVIKETRFLNPASGDFDAGDIAICGDVIVGTHQAYRGKVEIDGRGFFVVPGFIDSHVHLESSLVTPDEFDRCVVPRGTTTAICDPHEICNVLGIAGLDYVLGHAGNLVLDLRVQLPSCVPATDLETAGARLDARDLIPYRQHPAVIGLAEMMNFPGLFAADPVVLEKIAAFQGGHIDGHFPGGHGAALNAYAACGIRTCHESTSADEAMEKLRKGMQVLVREGSLSKDAAALAPVFSDATWPFLAFCSDDRNPLDIMNEGHIDQAIRSAIAAGAPSSAVLRAATWGAAQAFGLRDRGKVAPGYRADLVLLTDVATCAVGRVIAAGRPVDDTAFAATSPVVPSMPPVGGNSVHRDAVVAADFAMSVTGPTGPVIGLLPGSIVTRHLSLSLPTADGRRQPDRHQDVQKVCVLARHGTNRNIGRGFVQGFGLRAGALASSVGHDSHNLIAVGTDDADMALAVNRVIALRGGMAVVEGGRVLAELALPIAGLMSPLPVAAVGARLQTLGDAARGLGCRLADPFQQLAFLPLPVVPHLKITDRGLVDVDRFALIAA